MVEGAFGKCCERFLVRLAVLRRKIQMLCDICFCLSLFTIMKGTEIQMLVQTFIAKHFRFTFTSCLLFVICQKILQKQFNT